MRMAYRKGYKYQLAAGYSALWPHVPPRPIRTDWILFDVDGLLTLIQGYAWDGPSGPTLDSPSTIRASGEHDAIYQLIRLGLLTEDPWREWADLRLRAVLLQDGMLPGRALFWYNIVHDFAGPAAHPSAERPVLYTPYGKADPLWKPA